LPLLFLPLLFLQALPKIKSKTMAHFSSQISDHQLTIFTTHSTTFSPQKHHTKNRFSPKYPCKNTNPTMQKKIRAQRPKNPETSPCF
jgi:hypothetical protein